MSERDRRDRETADMLLAVMRFFGVREASAHQVLAMFFEALDAERSQ